MPVKRRLAKGIELDAAEYDDNLTPLDQPTQILLTITGGVITIPSSGLFPAPATYRLLPESGTADDLTQINGALGHEEEIVLRVHTVGHVITVINTPPNLCLDSQGPTFLLDSVKDHISFRSPAVNVWAEHARKSVSP